MIARKVLIASFTVARKIAQEKNILSWRRLSVLKSNVFDSVKPISINMNVLSGLAEYSHGAENRSLDFNSSLQQLNI